MKRILIYRHPQCERCARFARLHHLFDWFNRISDTTAAPPTGPLRMGEIVVEDLATRRFFRGADALSVIYRQAVAYWLFIPLLWIPYLRVRMDRAVRGDADENRQIDSIDDSSPPISTRA